MSAEEGNKEFYLEDIMLTVVLLHAVVSVSLQKQRVYHQLYK